MYNIYMNIYVHIPFCVSKCPYCAFESAPPASGGEELFVRTLEREIELKRGLIANADTVYFGGGTPTALSPDAWRRAAGAISRVSDMSRCAEITCEANPVSMTEGHIAAWWEFGVTRVSLGCQSFSDAELRFLGRAHDAADAARAAETVKGAGFDLSIDLIFGLPGAELRDWARSVRTALALEPEHLSLYQLTIEDGTEFCQRGVEPGGGEGEYRWAQWYLAQKGYRQYEIASFARPGHESRHNLNYWDEGEYVGLGPGAWSYVGGWRRKDPYPLAEWARRVALGSPDDAVERLEGDVLAREAAVLALRTAHGIEWTDFEARYGRSAEEIRHKLAQYPPELVISTRERTCLTPRGMRVANAIWSDII